MIDWILGGGAAALSVFTSAISPLFGPLSAAVAVVILTLVVRLALTPLAALQVKSEITQRRLAPKIRELRDRHKGDLVELQKALALMMAEEKVSPLSSLVPLLAQAPVLFFVYALFTHKTIDGVTNSLLSAHLFGASLGMNFLAAAGAGVVWPSLVVLAVLAIAIEFSRRANRRWSPPSQEVSHTIRFLIIVIPFVTILFAAHAPLAAAIYITVSTIWGWLERAVYRKRFAPIS